ncbi:hypothetical protein EG856_00370 [Mycoplasmopsis phocirhinis]|uniref:Uncharacterized protein n=1 Tax=Mycoplasmopsis phocirhinis TaxID=142650 RepID=A0A4P6MN41_9BACT|nr:hypothetical protein [Mycoplasmopsis phocirhinis]QBF34393.1 hypothetical protein EG856_00370 [Mycoplasmopsis phocirhinis]
MKAATKKIFYEKLPNVGYDSKSLLNSLIKEDEQFENDLKMFFNLIPDNDLIEKTNDFMIKEEKLNLTNTEPLISLKELSNIKINLHIFEQKLKQNPTNYFNKISLQDKTIAQMIKQNYIETQLHEGLDTGLKSRFDDADTMTLDDSAEIVITKVEL